LFHFSDIKIQVKHFDRLFRLYIKTVGEDTVCRVEEEKIPGKPAIEFINETFNPTDKIEKQIMKIEKKLDQVLEYARTTIGSSDVN